MNIPNLGPVEVTALIAAGVMTPIRTVRYRNTPLILLLCDVCGLLISIPQPQSWAPKDRSISPSERQETDKRAVAEQLQHDWGKISAHGQLRILQVLAGAPAGS